MAAFSGCSGDEPPAGPGSAGQGGEAGEEAGGAGVAGTAGEAGAGGAAGASGAAGAADFVEPTLLSETGLYTDIESETLAPGVQEYAPAYELWSDGAEKRRWVYLPPGSVIDSSDMDFWSYPVGTKLWKEFTRDGVRVETRLLHKYGEGQWFMMAYEWNDDESDAEAMPGGHEDARETDHDVPSRLQCGECHENMPDRALGFSAIQLSHSGPGLTIDDLVSDELLSDPPSAPFELPGDDAERAALGYLHANCGMCHNDGGESEAYLVVQMALWLRSGSLSSPDDTPTYSTTINRETESYKESEGVRIVPGEPEQSVLFQRFTSADENLHMPPLAVEIVDPTGQQLIQEWIEGLE